MMKVDKRIDVIVGFILLYYVYLCVPLYVYTSIYVCDLIFNFSKRFGIVIITFRVCCLVIDFVTRWKNDADFWQLLLFLLPYHTLYSYFTTTLFILYVPYE